MSAASRSFTITRCLGRGGFGEVYRARMFRGEGLDTDVALKVLRRDIDPDGQAVERLRDEGRLLARLNHPAILKVHDLVVLGGRVALVTEYVDGDDLSQCLRGEGRIETRALLQAVAVIAGALATAWDSPGPDGPLHLVHRDIKPSNIRISRHGDVKLLDFGIARSDAEGVQRESRTRTGMMVGSPAYMAPERFTERAVHLGSDVFSLCAVLFEGCTGERFYGDLPIPMQVGLAVDEERFEAHLASQLAKVDEGPLRALLELGLAHEVERRPHPSELARTLDAVAESQPGSSLGRYARERGWSDGVALAGELDGQTLSESVPAASSPSSIETLEQPVPLPPTVALQVEPPSGAKAPPPRRWPWVVGALVASGVAAAMLVLLTGGLAALPYVLGGEAQSVPESPALAMDAPGTEPEPHEPLTAEPEPEPEPEPVPTVPSRPKPIVPAPVAKSTQSAPIAREPDVAPVARPAPAPLPEPAPTPVPAPPAPTGTVALSGGVVALLVGPSGRHRLPGEVPVGTYRLQALFNGLDPVDVTSVTVAEGAQLRVDCSARFTRCTVK